MHGALGAWLVTFWQLVLMPSYTTSGWNNYCIRTVAAKLQPIRCRKMELPQVVLNEHQRDTGMLYKSVDRVYRTLIMYKHTLSKM